MDKIFGIDVSYWQTITSWADIAKKAMFAFIRAGIGSLDDKKFNENALNSKGHLPRGFYYVPWNTAEVSARTQLAKVIELMYRHPWEINPVLDIERPEIAISLVFYLTEGLFAEFGVYPIIYTSPGWWNNRWRGLSQSLKDKYWAVFKHCDLWTAHYGVSEPQQVEPWTETHFHQYSQTGTIDGIRGGVDENNFHGSYSDLLYRYNIEVDPNEPEIPIKKRFIKIKDTVQFYSFRTRPEFYPGDRAGIGAGVEGEIIEEIGDWYKIVLKDGNTNWIYYNPKYVEIIWK